MIGLFYLAGLVAVLATALAISRSDAVHALLYVVVSLLAVAVDLYLLGAPFVAALEVIIYAGAIMVLFLFVIMLIDLGRDRSRREGRLLRPSVWVVPGLLALVLACEMGYVLALGAGPGRGAAAVAPFSVGLALFGPYLVGVEIASVLLLAGLVGTYHLGRRVAQRRARP